MNPANPHIALFGPVVKVWEWMVQSTLSGILSVS
jgi:hypothetical protein